MKLLPAFGQRLTVVFLLLFSLIPAALLAENAYQEFGYVPFNDTLAEDGSNRRYVSKEDATRWEEIYGGQLTPDGKWINWWIMMENGERNLFVKNIRTKKMFTIKGGSAAMFTNDSKYVSYWTQEGKMKMDLMSGIKVKEENKRGENKLAIDSNIVRKISGILNGTRIYDPFLSEDGNIVFFKLYNHRSVSLIKNEPAEIDKPDIWHWQDWEIESRVNFQKRLELIWEPLFLWAYNRDSKLIMELGNDVQLSDNKHFALITVKGKHSFKEELTDVYLVNVRTGEKTKLLENFVKPRYRMNGRPPIESIIQFSPDATSIAYYHNLNWWVYNISGKKKYNVTQSIDADFWDTDYDMPGSVPCFGWAGWSQDSKQIFLYDKFDVFAIQADNGLSQQLTNGKNDAIEFRVLVDNYKKDVGGNSRIPLNRPILLSAFGLTTKASGYFQLYKGNLKKLVYDNLRIGNLSKAENADVYSYTVEGFDKSPSLKVAGDGFKKPVTVTTTNPQQQYFYWGKSELITYVNRKGKKMQGALYYPANYSPRKKYPMVVHVYEQLSDNLHRYPGVGAHIINNKQNYTNNDYFVFEPDISFEINDPGISAANCVIPAVEEVLKNITIDKDRLGLMGHSWGGYETTFIISQTNLFKAAVAGAPLTDLVSMSLGMRWNGTSTNMLFEGAQARFSGPFYEQTNAYIRNSPVYQAMGIATPLLIAVGNNDGFVDWHQGMELFNVLRRMQKPCVMLVYDKGDHYLNKEDYALRQMEYFDHYLKGKAAAVWMMGDTLYKIENNKH